MLYTFTKGISIDLSDSYFATLKLFSSYATSIFAHFLPCTLAYYPIFFLKTNTYIYMNTVHFIYIPILAGILSKLFYDLRMRNFLI